MTSISLAKAKEIIDNILQEGIKKNMQQIGRASCRERV